MRRSTSASQACRIDVVQLRRFAVAIRVYMAAGRWPPRSSGEEPILAAEVERVIVGADVHAAALARVTSRR
jgi:hypothetical protein